MKFADKVLLCVWSYELARYSDLEGHTHRSMNVSRYRHYNGDFYENFTYGRNNRNTTCPCMLYENSLIYSLSLLMRSSEEEIQSSTDHVDTTKGWTLK